MSSRLIGAVLIDKGLITGDQLEVALEIQAKTGERLGEIVVAEFGVSRLELASVLAEQWAELDSAKLGSSSTPTPRLMTVEPLTPEEVQIRRPIGEIFVELGFITTDQLEAALRAQSETGARIGEILVEQGSLSRLDLASALAEQWSALQKLRPPAPVAAPQPWQNGSPVPSPDGENWSVADRAAVSALEERLRLVERTAATSLAQEDLNRVQLELRAALGAVEARVEGIDGNVADARLADSLGALTLRLDVLEGAAVSSEVVALRREIEEMKAEPFATDLLADLSAAVERLETRPERADEIEGLAAEIGVLTTRLDELAGIGELRDRLDATAGQAELAQTGIQSLSSRLDSLGDLEARFEGIAARLPAEDVVADLRRELAALAVKDGTQEQSGGVALLAARVDQIAARLEDVSSVPSLEIVPRVDELSSRLDDVAAAIPTSEVDGLGARIESLEKKGLEGTGALQRLAVELEQLGARTAHLTLSEDSGLRERVDGVFARLAGIEAAVESVAGLESSVREGVERAVADGTRPLVERLDTAESRLGVMVELEGRLSALAAELERRPDSDALTADVAELRTKMETVADRTLIDELTLRLGGLVSRDELDVAAARHVQWFQAELATLRDAVDTRAVVVETALADVEQARAAHEQERMSALDASLGSVRSELREQQHALADGLGALPGHLAEEIAAARAASEQETAALRGDVGSLSARIDEILGLRHVDLQAARAADARLAEELETLGALRADDVEAARSVAEDLSGRLESLAGIVRADGEAARATAEGVGVQLADLQRLHSEDVEAAERAGADLVARLDDLAVRSAASAVEVEHALRSELGSLAARFEEYDGATIEARDELRSELERLGSSMGWRLERIEESLASDDSAALRETVVGLERRLEGQAALGEEQAKATERALRKGLAALGERLVDSESAYVEAGNTLRRSIERLGAAVVEADARMADQIPVSPLEGCVAFAPTADGYRLIELPGEPPEIGAMVELEACEGPLVVTRYGRSPLPFDGRPCAYLDRA